MKIRPHLTVMLCMGLLLILGLWLRPVLAHTAKPGHAQPLQSVTLSPAQAYFTDVVLVNQDGESMRFYSDLLKDRVVVISAFYTNCPEVCPVMTHKLAQIQERLGDRMGTDVHLISLSVDPKTDTPARLKAYADKFHPKPGWHFLTGTEANMALALRKLGQFVEAKEGHSNILIIGNEPTGLWKKAFGLASTDALITLVEGVLHNK